QTVPEGCYFVLGDNRRDSRDSRSFGCVPKEKVLGVVTDFVIENKDNVFLQILTSFV
ncbi:MAG: signal peptidase I, partial [Clostridia bacterium]|nr:signal peptidase I [Clostridia bacterium]